MAQSQEAEGDADAEQTRPWASMTPESRIEGTPRELIYSGDLNEEQNDTSFGLVLENPSVVRGTLFRNTEKPSDGTTDDAVEDQPRPTDYRIADPDDRDTTIVKGSLTTGENGPNVYDEADGFDEEEILIWFNGMSGQRISRVLDFNGRPFARWTDSGYLIKGLYQAANGWRDANSDQRSNMAQNGQAPRVVRFPVLRNSVDVTRNSDGEVTDATLLDEPEDFEILIDLTRYRGGRGYELQAFEADGFEAEFGSKDVPTEDLDRDDYYNIQADSVLDMPYTNGADEILDQVAADVDSESIQVAADLFVMETGDGWQDKPEGAETGTESTSFDVEPDHGGSSDGGMTLQEQEFAFAEQTAGALPHGKDPAETYEGGLEGLVERNADKFDGEPDIEHIREEVYAQTKWLDLDDLQ